jgi:hypothetical protein
VTKLQPQVECVSVVRLGRALFLGYALGVRHTLCGIRLNVTTKMLCTCRLVTMNMQLNVYPDKSCACAVTRIQHYARQQYFLKMQDGSIKAFIVPMELDVFSL